jgi:hypothetical protein
VDKVAVGIAAAAEAEVAGIINMVVTVIVIN